MSTVHTKPGRRSRGSTEAAGLVSQFGSRLRRARTDAGKTLRDISERSGISITYLSDLERGTLANPTLDTLKKIAEALEVSLNELLGVDEAPPPTRYPKALEEFSASPHFRTALEEQAQRERVSAQELKDDWLQAMAGIRIRGRTPKDSSDYLFIFEAIRRALERR